MAAVTSHENWELCHELKGKNKETSQQNGIHVIWWCNDEINFMWFDNVMIK